MVALGAVLIAVGIVIVIPRRMIPGSTSNEENLAVGPHWIRSPRGPTDAESRRRKLFGVLIGLGLIALGGLCIASGS
jgi:hypothetical protein